MSNTGGPSQEEAFARIRLLRSPNLGPVTYVHLLRRFGNAVKAIEALPEIAGRAGRRYSPAPERRIHEEIAAARKAGARYLFHDSADYPPLLAETEGAPPILTCRGGIEALCRPCVAMVGARNASAAAVRLAREIAHDLAAEGWTVVSGLARGIDGAAHRGALAAGSTVGVIASGIDIAYPPEHASLQEEVAQHGLLIAEQAPGTAPLARHFPARNRIIAGLCLGTVVVEAAPRSGSLITARLANDMGRQVMAIPGSPLDPRSHGCNQLIREGATLVQDAQEIIEQLTDLTGAVRALREPVPAGFADALAEDGMEGPAEADPADVTGLLTTAPIAIDELIRQSGASASAVQLALLELELCGRLARHAGGRVSLG
ncbi:DNA-processing protein DprA [Novosphingobium resinovorum]|uniref:DNA-processing protein DprA n=1 Tax=Novosphingobium resinovorum TaxID=158500 RepID=UPI002ED1098F|nr:DNA-processing protein DprA [Novosphingobium resinovorum]